jgi:large subunit ribosomal protein L23
MIKSKLFDVLQNPILTEKATHMNGLSKYTFEVPSSATKADVKEAVEAVFSTEVEKVNVVVNKPRKRVFKGRLGTVSGYKKAIVTLKKGKTIELSAGA